MPFCLAVVATGLDFLAHDGSPVDQAEVEAVEVLQAVGAAHDLCCAP